MVDVTAQLPRRQGQRPARSAPHSPSPARGGPRHYAALDLGTNNCRLLIARPQGDGFAVVDAFSRIVRLGEGLSANGALSDAAIERWHKLPEWRPAALVDLAKRKPDMLQP